MMVATALAGSMWTFSGRAAAEVSCPKKVSEDSGRSSSIMLMKIDCVESPEKTRELTVSS